jgi:UDP-N-acetylglucosamine:LPS N-acetylglucosamine transferase
MWLCRHVDRYFVALDETREHLARLGVDEARITVSGIPSDPVFAEAKDQGAMRRKHGLDAGRATILVAGGGFGVGPMAGWRPVGEPRIEERHGFPRGAPRVRGVWGAFRGPHSYGLPQRAAW